MADLQHVKGLKELQAFLDKLPVKMEKNIMRGALRAGTKLIQGSAKSKVHSVSGELVRSIKLSTKARGGLVTAKVVAGKGFGVKGMPPSNLPIWVEYGTAAHFISVEGTERKVRAINKSLKIGGHFVGPGVHHPGARPHPFMRPALDEMARPAVNAAAHYIRERLKSKHGLDTSGVILEGDE